MILLGVLASAGALVLVAHLLLARKAQQESDRYGEFVDYVAKGGDTGKALESFRKGGPPPAVDAPSPAGPAASPDGPPPPLATPHAAAPTSPAEVVAAGGRFWSAPREASIEPDESGMRLEKGRATMTVPKAAAKLTSVTPDNAVWIWPVEDRPFQGPGAGDTFAIHWRLPPGRTLPAGDIPPQGKLCYETSTPRGVLLATAIMAVRFEGGPDEGTARFPQDVGEVVGDDLLVWIELVQADGSIRRSNFLRLRSVSAAASSPGDAAKKP